MAVNMQGTGFTLARFKMIPSIMNLIVDVIFMIVRCDVVENYKFLRDSQQVLMDGL